MIKFNYQIVYATYNPETGISEVMINPYTGGSFIGRAKTHPEEPAKSRFYGCELAERRAVLNYLRANLAEKRAVLKALRTLDASFSKGTKKISRAIANATADYKNALENIERFKAGIKNMELYRNNFIKKISKNNEGFEN